MRITTSVTKTVTTEAVDAFKCPSYRLVRHKKWGDVAIFFSPKYGVVIIPNAYMFGYQLDNDDDWEPYEGKVTLEN